MDSSAETHEAAVTANELYWGSDQSVNQIAEELNLSKGALYSLIRPLAAGVGCPDCQQEVFSPNRTARERGLLTCASCGWEGDFEETVSFSTEGAVTLPAYAGEDSVPPPPASVVHWRNRTIAGGALLGAAAGLAFVLWSRRK